MKYIIVIGLLFSQIAYSVEYKYKTQIDLGINKQYTKNSNETEKSIGLNYNLAIGLTFDQHKFNNDIMIGYMNHSSSTSLKYGQYSAYHVKSHELYIQGSSKYKLSKLSDLGLSLNFIPRGILLQENDSSKLQLGITGSYLFKHTENVDYKIAGSIFKTLDGNQRNALIGLVSLQLEWNNNASNIKTVHNSSVFYKKRDITKIILDEQLINFETNSFLLTTKSQALLTELAAFLASKPNLWQALEITGHTDYRGDEDYNTILSIKRANEVYRVMSSIEMPKDRIIFLGKGKKEPLVNGKTDEDLAINRRVELKFIDVSDKDELYNFIAMLKNKYKIKK